MKTQNLLFIFLSFSLMASSKTRQHKFHWQAYFQGNTDYVGTGNLGIESTLVFENDYNASNTFYLPNNDITYGVNENFELLLGLDSFYSQNTGWGIPPIDFGAKYNIYAENSTIPQIDVIAKVQTENLGSKNLAISKTLPAISLYATKNFSKNCHSVFDFGLQWIDTSSHPSFTMDFYSEYQIDKKDIVNFEINDFSTDERFLNLILGVGAERDISENFALEFNCGKYLKNNSQNYYFSFGFNKTFSLAKKREK